jgi:uncharacterized membrane protein YqgA involved in biofilm formation
MTGTLINIVTVLVGSLLGVIFGGRLSDNVRTTVLRALGLVTLFMGIKMAISSANELIVLGSVVVGGLLGEWWGIEDGLERLGSWLEARFNPGEEGSAGGFIRGFVTASLLFCVGPLTFIGALRDGLTGDYRLLAIKAMLDGFASLAFSSVMGIGVAFSTLVILVYQGGLSLLARQAEVLLSDAMIDEMTAAGGVLIMGLAISTLLEIKPIRVGNYLPALLIAPLVVWVLTALGLPITLQF